MMCGGRVNVVRLVLLDESTIVDDAHLRNEGEIRSHCSQKTVMLAPN